MNSEQMVHLAQKQLDAYNKRDLDLFLECYHFDVTVTNLVSGKIICQGIAAFKNIYRELFDKSPTLHCDLKSRIVLDAAVIDEEFVTGLANRPAGVHAVAIYGFRDGKIDRVWFPR